MWSRNSSKRRRHGSEIIRNRDRRFPSRRLGRESPPASRQLDIVGATPIRIAQDEVGILGIPVLLRIGSRANIWIDARHDSPVREQNLSRFSSHRDGQSLIKVALPHKRSPRLRSSNFDPLRLCIFGLGKNDSQ